MENKLEPVVTEQGFLVFKGGVQVWTVPCSVGSYTDREGNRVTLYIRPGIESQAEREAILDSAAEAFGLEMAAGDE